MKTPLTITMILLCHVACCQDMTLNQWNEAAKTNIRLLPKYGHAVKTDGQKESDKKYIESSIKEYVTKEKAFDHAIEMGFQYLYKDVKTAMYRFNQAYLLDSMNADIYWGYGAVYMTIRDFENARKQYKEGLALASKNTHILTDYGTYFMSQYYTLEPVDAKAAGKHLDSAMKYLTRSYLLDNNNPNTTFKLSVCYYQKNDCKNAWKFYDKCVALGGQPITNEYTSALKETCKKK